MIELAKMNNPNASFAIMDCRQISNLTKKYDAIIYESCLPYESQTDVENLIFDAKNLLNDNGILYTSFVEGDPNKSGFQIGSNGDRSYLYYHFRALTKTTYLKT